MEPYLVVSQGLEPRMPEASDLQSDAVTCSARSPLVLTHSNSLSFCPIVLCTDGRVCVIKQTTHLLWTCRCNLSVRQSALLLLPFYTFPLAPGTYHPVVRPRLPHVLSAPQDRVPYTHFAIINRIIYSLQPFVNYLFVTILQHLKKTPGCLVLGSLSWIYCYPTGTPDNPPHH